MCDHFEFLFQQFFSFDFFFLFFSSKVSLPPLSCVPLPRGLPFATRQTLASYYPSILQTIRHPRVFGPPGISPPLGWRVHGIPAKQETNPGPGCRPISTCWPSMPRSSSGTWRCSRSTSSRSPRVPHLSALHVHFLLVMHVTHSVCDLTHGVRDRRLLGDPAGHHPEAP